MLKIQQLFSVQEIRKTGENQFDEGPAQKVSFFFLFLFVKNFVEHI